MSIQDRFHGIRISYALLVLLFSCSGLTQAGPILIGPAKAVQKFTIENKTDETAYDLHFNITSAHNLEFLVNKVKRSGQEENWISLDPIITNNMAFVDYRTGEDEKAVAKNEKVDVSIELKGDDNIFRVDSAFWTRKDRSNIRPMITEIPGFIVRGDPIYTIFNDHEEAMEVRGLEFLVDVPEIPIDDLAPGLMTGFGFDIPDFVLGANSSREFIIPGNIGPGRFLYAQGQTYNVASGELVASFIHGHQSPVSEPSGVMLLLAGCLVLLLNPVPIKSSSRLLNRALGRLRADNGFRSRARF